MSYSISLTAPRPDLAAKADAVTEAVTRYQPLGPAVEETRDHLSVVTDVVRHLTSVLGVDGDQVDVRVDGHANVDHGRAEGWADEFIQVRVAVARRNQEGTPS